MFSSSKMFSLLTTRTSQNHQTRAPRNKVVPKWDQLKQECIPVGCVPPLIDRISLYPMHSEKPKKPRTPLKKPCTPQNNHACPPKKPCMPPQKSHTPRKNHAHPPKKPHTPKKPCMAPEIKKTHTPLNKPHMPPPPLWTEWQTHVKT